MAMTPVRNLGQYGVIKDVAPYDLPINAWSTGINVRFTNNRVRRGSIFRHVSNNVDLLGEPRIVFGLSSPGNVDTMLLVNKDMTVYSLINSTLTDISPTSLFTASDSDTPVTIGRLSGVTYINRETHRPFYMTDQGANFEVLPNWDSTWTCKALRPFKDYLIALNVTKNGTQNPTLVKWSDTVLAGTYPGSWDHTDTSKNAGEVPLSEISTEIVDGGTLKNSFMIYGTHETWAADYVGGNDIFNFRRLFSNAGIIHTNCWAEVDGYHYVFGLNDIYIHDGFQKDSIVDQLNREYVFKILNRQKLDKCFVKHNKQTQEIWFCLNATIDECAFPDVDNANFAAVYNYISKCWSFADLPNVTVAGEASVGVVHTYAEAETEGLTYDTIGGSYADQSDTRGVNTIMASIATVGITTTRLLGVDLSDGGSLAKPYVSEVSPAPTLERIGIDCDEIAADLEGKKQVQAAFPQVTLFDSGATFSIRLGSQAMSGEEVTWSPAVPYNPATQYKINSRINGRYLAMSVNLPQSHDAEFSGYDVDLIEISRR